MYMCALGLAEAFLLAFANVCVRTTGSAWWEDGVVSSSYVKQRSCCTDVDRA